MIAVGTSERGDLVGAWRFELQTSCAQDKSASIYKPLPFNKDYEKQAFTGGGSMCPAVSGCALLIVGSLQKSLQSTGPSSSLNILVLCLA
jgi:hypothetical protein